MEYGSKITISKSHGSYMGKKLGITKGRGKKMLSVEIMVAVPKAPKSGEAALKVSKLTNVWRTSSLSEDGIKLLVDYKLLQE